MSVREVLSYMCKAVDMVHRTMRYAQCAVSGVRVGAVVVACNKEGKIKLFSGCNIELSYATGFHAERVALLKALSEGYMNIISVVVTSNNEAYNAALCGYCRQDFMYVNPHCQILVLNPDKTVKINTTVIETLEYPYLSSSKISL